MDTGVLMASPSGLGDRAPNSVHVPKRQRLTAACAWDTCVETVFLQLYHEIIACEATTQRPTQIVDLLLRFSTLSSEITWQDWQLSSNLLKRGMTLMI